MWKFGCSNGIELKDKNLNKPQTPQTSILGVKRRLY